MESESRHPEGPSREREGLPRFVWWIVVGIVAALLAGRFAPDVRERFLPEPRAAFVALAADGDGVASDGGHELAAGRPFRLHAVLEAETLAGETVWYTDAPALRLGGRDVPPGAIRPWPADRSVRVRWLTVEGFAPYLAVGAPVDLERFRLVENFHADWGSGWSVEGRVAPRLALIEAGSPLAPLAFGVQRWAVRIELYASEDSRTPAGRWSSPGAEDVLADPSAGTWLTADLPPPLALLSRSAGLPELDPAPELAPDVAERIDALVAAGLAYVAPRLLAAHLEAAGRAASALEFRTVSLGAEGPAWGTEARGGDLLRAGERVVVLLADAGVRGRLDPEDLVVDLRRGYHVARVDRVFRAEDGLRLDLAPVGDRDAPTAER